LNCNDTKSLGVVSLIADDIRAAAACVQASREIGDAIRTFIARHCPQIERHGRGVDKCIREYINVAIRRTTIKRPHIVFIPSLRLDRMTHKYKEIRKACCVMKGFWSRQDKICDRIIAWTTEFSDLVTAILKIKFRSLSRQRPSHNGHTAAPELTGRQTALPHRQGHPVTGSSSDCSKQSLSLYISTAHSGTSIAIDSITYPGADAANYTIKQTTNRPISPLQSIQKSIRRIIFAGKIEYDMDTCFPSIFRTKIMTGTAHDLITEMIDNKDAFLQRVVATNAFTGLIRREIARGAMTQHDAAKSMRSRLFMPRARTGRLSLRNIGVKWYDDLKNWIITQLAAANIADPHLTFTGHEQVAMEKAMSIVGPQLVLLRIHDGFIAEHTGTDNIVANITAMNVATGMRWKSKQP